MRGRGDLALHRAGVRLSVPSDRRGRARVRSAPAPLPGHHERGRGGRLAARRPLPLRHHAGAAGHRLARGRHHAPARRSASAGSGRRPRCAASAVCHGARARAPGARHVGGAGGPSPHHRRPLPSLRCGSRKCPSRGSDRRWRPRHRPFPQWASWPSAWITCDRPPCWRKRRSAACRSARRARRPGRPPVNEGRLSAAGARGLVAHLWPQGGLPRARHVYALLDGAGIDGSSQ